MGLITTLLQEITVPQVELIFCNKSEKVPVPLSRSCPSPCCCAVFVYHGVACSVLFTNKERVPLTARRNQ